MKIKKVVATTAVAGALGFAALGLGSGFSHADPKWPNIPGPPNPPIPGVANWAPGGPPGHNPFGPPGHVKKGFYNVPPGHWNDRARLGIPDVWLPPVELRPDFPDLNTPLKVEWNAEAAAFGVRLSNGAFIAYR